MLDRISGVAAVLVLESIADPGNGGGTVTPKNSFNPSQSVSGSGLRPSVGSVTSCLLGLFGRVEGPYTLPPERWVWVARRSPLTDE
jgi:hypothetical protein